MQRVGSVTINTPVSVADELEAKTLAYWQLSLKWNGRTEEKVSCSSAFDITRPIIRYTNPERPIVRHAKMLTDEIVRNRRVKKLPGNNPSSIIYLNQEL